MGIVLLLPAWSHFVEPARFVAMIPPFLPWPEELVLVSGVVELIVALGLLVPRSRRPAAWAGIALFLAGLASEHLYGHLGRLPGRVLSVSALPWTARSLSTAVRWLGRLDCSRTHTGSWPPPEADGTEVRRGDGNLRGVGWTTQEGLVGRRLGHGSRAGTGYGRHLALLRSVRSLDRHRTQPSHAWSPAQASANMRTRKCASPRLVRRGHGIGRRNGRCRGLQPRPVLRIRSSGRASGHQARSEARGTTPLPRTRGGTARGRSGVSSRGSCAQSGSASQTTATRTGRRVR